MSTILPSAGWLTVKKKPVGGVSGDGTGIACGGAKIASGGVDWAHPINKLKNKLAKIMFKAKFFLISIYNEKITIWLAVT